VDGIILWQVESKSITRKGDATAGTIDDVSSCGMDLDLSVAAVRNNGHLKVIARHASADQLVVERRGDSIEEAGEVKEIATCRIGTDLLVTAVRDSTDNLKVILWELVAEGAQITRRESDEGKGASKIAVWSRLIRLICHGGPRS
jgi:hypothetical protein